MQLHDVEFRCGPLYNFELLLESYLSVQYGCSDVVLAYNRNISAPFYGEEGRYINARYICGGEGTAVSEYENYEEHAFNYSSILTCQDECDAEDTCICYSYDHGASDGKCEMHYAWIAGLVTPKRNTGGVLFGWVEEDGG